MSDLKVLGVIPARYNSSRFPGKPLIDLKGKSMIQRVYEGASKSTLLAKVIVATDDQRIVDEVLRFGGNVLLTESSHETGTDRCGEIARHFSGFDVVVNIQGDEPLVDFRQLDQLIESFKNPAVNIATLGTHEISLSDINNENRIKIVINKNQQALYFSRSPIPNYAKIGTKNPLESYPFMRHIGLYAYRAEILQELVSLTKTPLEQIESLEQLRWLYHGYKVHVALTNIETPNIDVPEDVQTVLNLL